MKRWFAGVLALATLTAAAWVYLRRSEPVPLDPEAHKRSIHQMLLLPDSLEAEPGAGSFTDGMWGVSVAIPEGWVQVFDGGFHFAPSDDLLVRPRLYAAPSPRFTISILTDQQTSFEDALNNQGDTRDISSVRRRAVGTRACSTCWWNRYIVDFDGGVILFKVWSHRPRLTDEESRVLSSMLESIRVEDKHPLAGEIASFLDTRVANGDVGRWIDASGTDNEGVTLVAYPYHGDIIGWHLLGLRSHRDGALIDVRLDLSGDEGFAERFLMSPKGRILALATTHEPGVS